MKNLTAKPFVKWAGGKTQLLPELTSFIPYQKNDTFTYIEPFVGSGAMLFYMLQNYPNIKRFVINDINTDLITTYIAVKSYLYKLLDQLTKLENEYHALENDIPKKESFYYIKRDLYNNRISEPTTQAALFIFLNKTCYNGLYRVNQNNQFNVPIGKYKKPVICDVENLTAVNKALQNVEILNADFEITAIKASSDTFFYFDPPYRPISDSASFNTYSHMIFDDNEQIRLKNFCDKLNNLHYKWLMSNSDPQNIKPDSFFENLYQAYTIRSVKAKRLINSDKDKRGTINELIISNY